MRAARGGASAGVPPSRERQQSTISPGGTPARVRLPHRLFASGRPPRLGPEGLPVAARPQRVISFTPGPPASGRPVAVCGWPPSRLRNARRPAMRFGRGVRAGRPGVLPCRIRPDRPGACVFTPARRASENRSSPRPEGLRTPSRLVAKPVRSTMGRQGGDRSVRKGAQCAEVATFSVRDTED